MGTSFYNLSVGPFALYACGKRCAIFTTLISGVGVTYICMYGGGHGTLGDSTTHGLEDRGYFW